MAIAPGTVSFLDGKELGHGAITSRNRHTQSTEAFGERIAGT
jgi:hypothetical protein